MEKNLNKFLITFEQLFFENSEVLCGIFCFFQQLNRV